MTDHPSRPKAYSYVRFSTPEQQLGQSRRRQIDMARAYATGHGLDLQDASFEDLGVSAYKGANAVSGALGMFLRAIQDEAIEPGSYLLVESLDRLSRESAMVAMGTLSTIIGTGVSVVALDTNTVYNTETLESDPSALLLMVVGFIRANDESRTKSRRVRDSRKARREALVAGAPGPWTRKGPSWLEWSDASERWEVLPDQAEKVRAVFRLFVEEGLGQNATTKELNQRGIPSLAGGDWHRSAVLKVLRNDAVTGTLVIHESKYDKDKRRQRKPLERLEGHYPIIIDQDVFERAQAKLGSGAARGKQASAPVQNVLAGLAVCPKCGGRMTRTNKSDYSYLVCSKAKRGAGCVYKTVRYDQVQAAVYRVLPDLWKGVDTGNEGLDAELDAIESLAESIHQQIETLLDNLSYGRNESLLGRIRVLEGELEKLNNQRMELIRDGSNANSDAIRNRLRKLGTEDDKTPGETNEALRQALRLVEVDYDRGDLSFVFRNGSVANIAYSWPKG